MKNIIMMVLVSICCAIQSADLPDEPKPNANQKVIDFSTLFRRSGKKNDPTSIKFYLQDENSDALKMLIDQAKAQKRNDVLEKAVKHAIDEGKLNALELLLDEGAPLLDELIKGAIERAIEYKFMEGKKKRLHEIDYEIFRKIIGNIMGDDKEREFDVCLAYVVSKRTPWLLFWLLTASAHYEHRNFVMKVTNAIVDNLSPDHIADFIQRLTAIVVEPQMARPENAEERKLLQKIIRDFQTAIDNAGPR